MTIGPFTMPAVATRLARIGRVDQPDLNARPGRLVGHKQAQLKEGPGMPFVSLRAPNRCLVSNAGEVFECECLARYDSFCYQGLTDGMVDILHLAALPPSQMFEAAFCGAMPARCRAARQAT